MSKPLRMDFAMKTTLYRGLLHLSQPSIVKLEHVSGKLTLSVYLPKTSMMKTVPIPDEIRAKLEIYVGSLDEGKARTMLIEKALKSMDDKEESISDDDEPAEIFTKQSKFMNFHWIRQLDAPALKKHQTTHFLRHLPGQGSLLRVKTQEVKADNDYPYRTRHFR